MCAEAQIHTLKARARRACVRSLTLNIIIVIIYEIDNNIPASNIACVCFWSTQNQNTAAAAAQHSLPLTFTRNKFLPKTFIYPNFQHFRSVMHTAQSSELHFEAFPKWFLPRTVFRLAEHRLDLTNTFRYFQPRRWTVWCGMLWQTAHAHAILVAPKSAE